MYGSSEWRMEPQGIDLGKGVWEQRKAHGNSEGRMEPNSKNVWNQQRTYYGGSKERIYVPGYLDVRKL